MSWESIGFCMLLLLFFGLNLLFLTRFPFVHSDESWLAGLTRNMMEQRSLGVTEAFFDLKPRFPHAIKSLFHLLQMPLVTLFGYQAFSVRLLSLLGGCLCLFLFWRCAKWMTGGRIFPLLLTGLLACDVQFICASHLARQEILICAAMLACVLLFLREEGALPTRTVLMLAVITGLSIGLHPNSFLVATLCGGVLLTRMLVYKTAQPRQIGLYAVVTGGFAAVFVAASFLMDARFPQHYLAYGESEFDLIVPVTSKIGELGYFFQKLWHQVSGTYYVPDLRPQLVLFPMLIAAAFVFALVMRRQEKAQSQRLLTTLAAAAGVLAGTVLIGRYNQTGFVFFVPLCWLLLPNFCAMCGERAGKGVFAAVLAVIVLTSVSCVRPWLAYSYDDYLGQIAAYVPADAKVVGNLNSEFYFENGKLLDYRNLGYLKENGKTFEEYVRENGVEYLVISEELGYIYSVRPKWNMIYGNLTGWYEDMREFAGEDCVELGRFADDCYGTRIIDQIATGEKTTVHIYKVNS